MPQCPHCNGELVQDPQNPQKLLCYNCKKRYDATAVDSYWAGQSQQSPDPYAATQPFQPTAQPVIDPAQAQTQAYQPAQAPMTDPSMAYGSPAPQQAPYGQQPPYYKAPGKGMAIVALVLGILAILGCIIPIFNIGSIILGLVAVILGIIAAIKASKGTAAGMGFGIAGAICGVLAIIASVVINVFVINAVNETIDETNWNELSNIIEEYDGNVENLNSQLDEWANSIIEENLNATNGSTNSLSNSNETNTAPIQPEENVLGEPAAVPPASVPGELGSDWRDMQISVDGQVITIGKTTVKEIMDNSDWKIDLEGAGYANGYVVNPASTVSLVELESEHYDDTDVYVSVANTTDQIIDITECTITSYSIEKPYSAEDPYPNVVLPKGITFNMTPDQVIAAYGQPSDSYDGGSYSSFDYDTGNYDYYFSVSFDNKQLSRIQLRSYL